MRKKKLTVLIFVSLAFLLTACGRQGSGKETAAEEPLKIETEAGNTRKEETQTPADGTEKTAPGTDMQEQEGKVPVSYTHLKASGSGCGVRGRRQQCHGNVLSFY